VNPRIVAATVRRVLAQLRRDRRTLALLIVVPCLLMTLLRLVYAGAPDVFDRIGAPLLGIFPFTTMFLVTSIATLRERTSGTLERLLTMPMAKLDLLLGYAVAFAAVAIVQVLVASALALGPLGLTLQGSAWLVVVLAVADALLGTALGLFVSAFAATEFQAVQFLPATVLPQLLLCGLFVPRGQMQSALRWVSDVLPLSYAVDGMTRVSASGALSRGLLTDLAVIVGFALAALVGGAATLRRRTA